MSEDKSKVFIVDDDDAVRKSLQLLFKTVGIEAVGFESGDEFLHAFDNDWQGCIVLDIRMPGTSGLEVQRILQERGCSLPIIFITGHGDVPMAVEAMQLGAFDFVQDPFRDQELMDRVNLALSQNEDHLEEAEHEFLAQQRFVTLTLREAEVMDCVLKG